jgi:UPF0176 protein
MEGCCSTACVEVIHLPEEEQKALRRGLKNGNMIFKKGKSEVLTYKDTASGITGTVSKKSTLAKRTGADPIKKTLIGKGVHYFPKASIGQFLIENGTLTSGAQILISGPTTGDEQMTVTEMFVNEAAASQAKSGDLVSFKLDFRIRLSDKLYILGA